MLTIHHLEIVGNFIFDFVSGSEVYRTMEHESRDCSLYFPAVLSSRLPASLTDLDCLFMPLSPSVPGRDLDTGVGRVQAGCMLVASHGRVRQQESLLWAHNAAEGGLRSGYQVQPAWRLQSPREALVDHGLGQQAYEKGEVDFLTPGQGPTFSFLQWTLLARGQLQRLWKWGELLDT